jgi:hypothetical protein
MANRFIKPQKANDVYHPVDHYIPLPFNDIAETLKQRQAGYDAGLAYKNDAEDQLHEAPSRNIDLAQKNALVNQYNNDIMDTVKNKYNGDWGAAHEDIANITRKYGRNEFFKRAALAANTEAEHQKFLDDARKQGKPVLDFDRSHYDTPVMNEDGSFNDLSRPESQLQLDWSKAMKDATALHANTFTSAAQRAGGDAKGYLQYVKNNGISDRQVRNSLNDARVRYLSSKEGQQHLDYLTRGQGLDQDSAVQRIDHDLLASGMQQVHTNQDRGYMKDLEQEHQNDMEKAMLAAHAKVAASKHEAMKLAPKMVPNLSNKGMDVQDNAAVYGTNKLSVPYLGKSDRDYNHYYQHYKPEGRAFAFGDNEGRAKYGQPTDETYDGVRFKNTIVGYKIMAGENAGAPLSKGATGSAKDTADDNHVLEENGQHFVINQDGQKIPVQPQAYKMLTTKDGKTIMEEANQFESMRDLGGANFSNQDFIEIDPQNGTVKNKLSNEQLQQYLGGPNAIFNNPHLLGMMQKVSQIERDGIKSQEDAQTVNTFKQLLDQGYYETHVLPSVINPKTEFTPKNSLGVDNEKENTDE